jgi:hypothetical protein
VLRHDINAHRSDLWVLQILLANPTALKLFDPLIREAADVKTAARVHPDVRHVLHVRNRTDAELSTCRTAALPFR